MTCRAATTTTTADVSRSPSPWQWWGEEPESDESGSKIAVSPLGAPLCKNRAAFPLGAFRIPARLRIRPRGWTLAAGNLVRMSSFLCSADCTLPSLCRLTPTPVVSYLPIWRLFCLRLTTLLFSIRILLYARACADRTPVQVRAGGVGSRHPPARLE